MPRAHYFLLKTCQTSNFNEIYPTLIVLIGTIKSQHPTSEFEVSLEITLGSKLVLLMFQRYQ